MKSSRNDRTRGGSGATAGAGGGLTLLREKSKPVEEPSSFVVGGREWERIFDSMPDLIAILDNRYRIVRVNLAMAKRLGMSQDECVGMSCYSGIHGAGHPPAFCPHAMTMADGCEHRAEVHEELLGGDFLVTTTPLHDENGRITGSVHIARDITERKRAEQALHESEARVRLKLESILSPAGDMGNLELSDIIDAGSIQSLMADFHSLTQIPMAIIDLKGKVLVGVGWSDICTRFHRVNPESLRNCIECDTRLTTGIPPGEYRLYKCKNNMWDVATPITIAGKHLGNLFSGQFFFDDEPPDYEVFRSQGRRYGFKEDEYIAALNSVQRLSRKTLDVGMGYLIKLADVISQLSYSNIKLARSLMERDALAESLRKNEERLKRIHHELEKRVLERTEELVHTVDTLQREVLVRERAEANLSRLNRLHLVLSEIAQAIIHATDRQSLFSDFCRIAVEQGGFLLAWVGLLDVENGQMRTVAASGATGYLDSIRITSREEPSGLGPTGISVREGTYYICNDFQNDPVTAPWHERGSAFGIKSSASVVIKEEGWVIGTLTLYAGETDVFDQQHVALLVQMGADVSFALDNLARENRRREAEQALREETLERLRAVEALREKERLLVQQSRLAAMGEMLNNIAHQWRQPLNILGLNIQRLSLFYGTDKFCREFLDTTVKDTMKLVYHMSQTIDDFRNFFKPDKEKVDFSVSQAIKQTIHLVEDSFKQSHVTVVTQSSGEAMVNGYPSEFSQVLLNIMQNAYEALRERNVTGGVITVATSVANGRTVITVADNAGGIPEEIIDRIFDPYFSTKGVMGTGIGLNMSKNIIETNMGGRLTVRNTGDGAEFRIEV